MLEKDKETLAVFEAFKKELKALLEKYDAGIEVEIPRDEVYAALRANVKTPGGYFSGILKEDYLVKAEDL